MFVLVRAKLHNESIIIQTNRICKLIEFLSHIIDVLYTCDAVYDNYLFVIYIYLSLPVNYHLCDY